MKTRVVSGFLFVMSCLFLTGCPLPVPRTAVIQPSISFVVSDEQGKRVEHATLYFTWASHPHSRIHKTTKHQVDAKGSLGLREKKRGEWVMPLMMHGVPFHFWVYCIKHPGYQTFERQIHKVPSPKSIVSVVLKRGQPTAPCFFERRQRQQQTAQRQAPSLQRNTKTK